MKVLNGVGYEEELTLSNPLLAGLLAVSGTPGVLALCTLCGRDKVWPVNVAKLSRVGKRLLCLMYRKGRHCKGGRR